MVIPQAEIKKSMALRAILPMNSATGVLLMLKLVGVLDITWLQALIPSISLAVVLGLMAEYGLHMCNREENKKNS